MDEKPVGVNLSNCCGAPAIVDGDKKEWTHCYVCSDCWKPCDINFVEAKK